MACGRIAAAVCAAAMAAAGATDKEWAMEKMKEAAQSPRYHLAWTHSWLNHGPWEGDGSLAEKVGGKWLPKKHGSVELKTKYTEFFGGKCATLHYGDLCTVTGTWYPPEYYEKNRATLTAAIKKQWTEFGGLKIFSWHIGHPYITNGFPKAHYRFKSHGEDRNVVRQILDGTGRPCGTGSVTRRTIREPFANPREWYMAQLKDLADFFNGLVDPETGRKIPVVMRYFHEADGAWFWWGETWAEPEDFVAISRMTADYLRAQCGPDQIIFAYTPDKAWRKNGIGTEGGGGNTFLSRYPGDAYVDIIGVDDYGIGNGKTAEDAEANLRKAIASYRELSKFADERGKVLCVSECGGFHKRDDFWLHLHRLMTAPGVKCAFADVWAGDWGINPHTEASRKDCLEFSKRPEVIFAGDGCGFRRK